MAIDPQIPLEIHTLPLQDPSQMMLNALKIKEARQQQMQQQVMNPIQAQSAQIGLQGQQLQLQQAQYQMDQQRKMAEAAQKAFGPQDSSQPAAQPVAPASVAKPTAMSAAPAIAAPMASTGGDSNPDEMPQLATPAATPPIAAPAAQAPMTPAAPMDGGNPDEMAQLPVPAAAQPTAVPTPPIMAPAAMAPNTPAATAQPPTATNQTPKAAAQPTATNASDPWERFFTNMQQSGVHPTTVMAMRKEHQQLLTGAAALTKDQQTILQNQMNVYADVAKTALNQPDDATREQYYQSTGRPALIQSGISAASLPPQLPTGDQGRAFLQQHLLTATANGAALSNVKAQIESAAQTLGSSTDGADYAKKWNNLKSGTTILPEVLKNFPTPQQYTGPETIQQARAVGQSTTEQENAPKQVAEAEQALRVSDATKLANAALISPQVYRDTLNALPHGRASAFPEAPADGQYDPKAFSAQVASMGLTPQERSVASTTIAARAETVRHNEAVEKARAVSNQIRMQVADRTSRGATPNDLNAQAKLNDTLTNQAIEDRAMAGQFDHLIRNPPNNGENVVLPDGKQVPWSDQIKQYVSDQSQLRKVRAQNLDGQATAIRARNHFGEFGVSGPASPVAAPVAPPTNNPPSKIPPPKVITDKLPVGIHTFGNGQTWQKNQDGSVVFVK